MAHLDSSCTFCRALKTPPPQRPVYDTVLAESRHFVVLPALGPLVPGHVIIVTREHSLNLLANKPDVLREYESIINRIRRRIPYDVGLLEAEHGPSDASRGGACIDHSHVNLIPGSGALAHMIPSGMPLLASAESVVQLPSATAPYILLRATGAPANVYDAKGLPSQFIRQQIARSMDRDDWDWGAFPRLDVIAETITIWAGRS